MFAPNLELCRLLEKATGRKCALMPRGVDTELFSPEYRERNGTRDPFVLGFCGRLSIEKNVFLLDRVRKELIERGKVTACDHEAAWTSAGRPRFVWIAAVRS